MTSEDYAMLIHPIRKDIINLSGFTSLTTISPSFVAHRSSWPIGTVAYHFRVLRDRGYIECVEERQVRGSIAHYYALTPKGRALYDAQRHGS